MIADVTLNKTTMVGVEGKSLSEILDKVCREWALSQIGRAKLIYEIRKEKESDANKK